MDKSSVPEKENGQRDNTTQKRTPCCCRCCTSTAGSVLLLIFGSLAIVSGAVFLPMIYDILMKAIVNDIMVLNPTSVIYPEWVEPSIPLRANFYFFEIRNPEEIYNGGKPELVEIGPYSYKMYVKRENITENGNGTISSVPVYTYIFDREKSVGPDTDRFLGINMPMTSTAYMARNTNRFVKESLSKVLESLNETMFIELSVHELLWGYDEPLFGLITDFLPIPGVSDQFGFLLGYNGTQINGMFTVHDGADDKGLLNRIDSWKGKSELDFWFTPEANQMNGTDGMMWSPFIDDVEELLLFHQDFCRSMPYVFTQDETFKGIPMRRFQLAPYAYKNGTTHPPNEGFCHEDTCAPTGIQRMDPCRFGSPMGMSNPHYLDSDPWLTDQIVGLQPDQDKHRNYFLLEPMMGMPYVMRQRLQINMYLEDVKGIHQMGDVRTMYVPSLWFSQEVDVPDNVLDAYKVGFQLTELIMQIIGYTLIVIGTVMIVPVLIAFIFKVTKSRRRSSQKNTIADKDNQSEATYKQNESSMAYTNNTFEIAEKDGQPSA